MSVEFCRWDLDVPGTEPPEEQGHTYVPVSELGCLRTFRGSRWAITFDLQWQYLCSYPMAEIEDPMSWGWFPPRPTEYGYGTVQRNRVAEDRRNLVSGAIDFAKRLLVMSDDEWADYGQRSFMLWCLHEDPFRHMLERLVDNGGPFNPTAADRAYWFLLGCRRWGRGVPKRVSDVGTCGAMSLNVSVENTCKAADYIEKRLRKDNVLNPLILLGNLG